MSAKYVIIVPDGAADNPQECYDGQTIIEAADTPNMDKIATDGRQGICRTVPDSMPP
ncbi:MAG: cofactor-independent phosphoglycerate mutase, partial [Planctomycetota bacterium]